VRRLLAIVSVLVAAPAAVIAVPVASVAEPQPHPVTPVLRHIALPISSAATLSAVAPNGVVGPKAAALRSAAAPAPAPAPASPPIASIPAQDTQLFRMLGLSWRHDPTLTALSAQIRVRTDGVWTPWQADASSDLGPDGGSRDAQLQTRDSTEPLWVNHADAVEVKVDSVTGPAPQDLRVDLIDPGVSLADKTLSKAASGLQSAAAAATQPAIISRAQWGADEGLRTRACPSGPEYTGMPQVAFVHHTVTQNGYNPGDSAAILRGIYAFHVQGNGWCDVGYNFLVDKYGQLFEGRFGGIDKAVLGAHTGGFNTNSFGVSMMGDYSGVAPSPELQIALAQLIAWKLSLSYANPMGTATLRSADFSGSRFATGTQVTLNVISGHRDADLTSCPGNVGYSMLPNLRQLVLADMGAGLVAPNATVSGRTVAGNGNVHVTAGMLFAGDWHVTVQDANGSTVRTLGGSGGSIDTTWDMTNDSGAPVPAGAYTLTVNSTQNGAVALPWSTPVNVGGVFGGVDDASAVFGKITVSGWALRGVDTNAAHVRVTVSSADAGSFVADQPRTDVQALYPAYGPNHGFAATVDAASGFHTVCVYGVNSDIGLPDSLLWCQGVTVPDVNLGPFTRLAGPDRFATAVAIGQAAAPTSTTVVIASGLAPPDAVAAGPLAAHLSAPLLLTAIDQVPAAVMNDIVARHATTAYVVGGAAVISAKVVSALTAAGVTTVTRLGGANRFETAALVAGQIGAAGGAAMVIDGSNAHLVDGFTIGGIAGHLGQPILMASATGIPPATAAALKALNIVSTTVVGASLPPAVVASLPGGTTIAGPDRYDTSVAVANAFSTQLGAGATVLANGASPFPVDALSAASLGRPTLLVMPASIPPGVATWLLNGTTTTAITVVGGVAVISDVVAGTAAGDARVQPI
jgi:ell wall binding domain 2 (CWB2)/N-acetylmuramoyl-L-alanine amidase/FlgD Ig-like domain